MSQIRVALFLVVVGYEVQTRNTNTTRIQSMTKILKKVEYGYMTSNTFYYVHKYIDKFIVKYKISTKSYYHKIFVYNKYNHVH